MSYKVFTRTWWKRNPKYPDGRELYVGWKTTIRKLVGTEKEARSICQQYSASHEPGPMSRKAEYEMN